MYTINIVIDSIDDDVCDDIINFFLNRLLKNHLKDDYRELLELTRILLGGKLPNGIRFKTKGAIHLAR